MVSVLQYYTVRRGAHSSCVLRVSEIHGVHDQGEPASLLKVEVVVLERGNHNHACGEAERLGEIERLPVLDYADHKQRG